MAIGIERPPSSATFGVKQHQILALIVASAIFCFATLHGSSKLMTQPREALTSPSTGTKDTMMYSYEPPESPIIAYASQGPAHKYKLLRDRFEAVFPDKDTYRFFYHSFDEDCDGCLFQEKTSFAQGKNILIKAIMESKEADRIKYIASFDNDAPMYIHDDSFSGEANQNGWKPFHELLLRHNTTHPFIKPHYYPFDTRDIGTTTYQSCTDENFWAIRKDHLAVIYPHSTYKEEYKWTNALRVFYLMEGCYPGAVMVHSNFVTGNPEHSYSAEARKWKMDDLRSLAVDMLRADYSALGPWDLGVDRKLDQRCRVQLFPSTIGLAPKCKEVMDDRFQRWLDGEFEP